MDLLGGEPFSGSGFAEEQDGRVGRGDLRETELCMAEASLAPIMLDVVCGLGCIAATRAPAALNPMRHPTSKPAVLLTRTPRLRL
jgi:hypothetical protein